MLTVYAIIGGIVAVIVAIGGAFLKGKQSGVNSVVVKQLKVNNETQAKFDKIDASKPDLDSALDRLRDRSK